MADENGADSSGGGTSSPILDFKSLSSRLSDRYPGVPMLLFLSNGEGTGWDQATWVGTQKAYASNLPTAEVQELNCPHHVHDHEHEAISTTMRGFVSELEK